MKKTILQGAVITSIFLVLGLFSTINAQFAGGAGTEADPYQVETAGHLDAVRYYLDSHFIQTADIDLGVSPWSDGEGWEPIGTDGDTFVGVLDGNGHTISNLYIDRNTGDLGLFGYIGDGGQVSNIRITNANITSTEARVGILAGYLDGNVTKTEVSGIVSGNGRVGGLVGAAELHSTITKVSADISITSTAERAGGLLGANRGDISNSYAYGSVSGSARVGGLVGNNYSGTVSNNYVAVELTGGGWTRGLVGDSAGGTYSDNFVDEDIANTTSTGGGTFRSTEEMKIKSTFTDAGWDFDTIWQIDEPQNGSISYPYLQSNAHFPVPGYFELQIPEVITHITIENITTQSAEVNGEVTDDKGIEVTERGFVYSTSTAPTTSDSKFLSGEGTGVFTESLSGLTSGTTYYLRAYAVNSSGTGYGDEIIFTTLSAPVFTSTPVTEVDYEQLYSYSIFTPQIGDLGTTFSAPTLPEWLTLRFDVQSEAELIGSLPVGTEFSGVAGDDNGNIYVAPYSGTSIYKIAPDGTTTEWATGLIDGVVYGLHVADNYLYIPRYAHAMTRINLDNPVEGEEVFASSIGAVTSLTDRGDWIYAANFNRDQIIRIHKTDKTIETVLTTADGLPNNPSGLIFDKEDNLYISTYNERSIIKYDGTSITTVLSGLPKTVTSVHLDKSGNFYVSMLDEGIRMYDSEWNHFTNVSSGGSGSTWSITFTNTGKLVYGLYKSNQVYQLQTGPFLSGTPAKTDVGSHPVVLEATNSVGSTQQSFSIDVQDNVSPVAEVFSPANQSTDIDRQPTLMITFDEEIELGMEGTLSLYDGSIELQSYDLSVPSEPDNFSLSADHKTLSLNVDADLPLNTLISVEISNGASDNFVQDIHGNAFAGFTANSDTWTFTTLSNTAPVADNVTVSGSPIIGEELTVSYDYSDVDGDPESGTTYQWFRSDDDQGTEKNAITDATSASYTITGDDIDKYISVAVTPSDGIEAGTAAESILIGPVASLFADGSGTEVNPYQITTVEQLDNLRNFLDSHFILTSDFNLGESPWSDGDGWDPIGENGNAFTGTFDGQGHTISGLTINRSTDFIGLFGYTNTGAIIRNLGLTDVSIRGRNTVGGLVGYLLDGTVSNSYVVGNINQNTNSGDDIGGLAGRSAGTITDSYADVVVGGSSRVGGLVGQNEGAIEGSYALGALLGSNRLGGFVGLNGGTGTISNSYSSVDVSSNDNNQDIFGGLVGQNLGAISNSYANGIMVVNQSSAGGLVGHNSGAINGSFWDTETSGQISSSGGTGKTTAEMRARSTFTDAGWDFDSVWQIVETSTSFSSPYLTGNEQNPAPGYLELTPPKITTQENLVNLTSESVEVTGQVTDDGNVEISHRGFVWATDAAPDDTTIVWSGSSDDTFTETISDLPPATALNVRSFATNMVGTAYGNLVSFETEPGELLLTGSFTVQDKVYDGETTAMIDQNSLSLDGVYSGHDVQIGTLEIAFIEVDAGVDRQVSIQSVTLSGQDAIRYTISLTNAPHSVADITERPITVSAGAQQVIYGDDDPLLSYEITSGSLVTGDQLFGGLERVSGQNVGMYAIEQGDLTAGDNYDITYVGADIEITRRTLFVTVDADQAKTYGENDPSFGFETSNFAWGDDESVLTGSLSREAGEDTGSYPITPGDLEAGGNYAIDFTNADFEITPKELSITAGIGQTKVYGDADPIFAFTASGFEFGDDEQILSGVLNRETGEDAGMYEIESGSLNAGDNYTISFSAADFEITPRTLILSNFTADDKIYDGLTDVSGAGFEDDRIGGDELTFSFEAAFADSDANTNKTVAFSSIAVSGGADVNNYDLQTTSGQASANISPRPITIAADDATVIYGENDPMLTYEITSGNLVDGDEFSGELNRTAGPDVGIYFIEQHTLSAGDNYEITYQTADFEITSRVLAIVAKAGQAKTYGDADSEFTYEASNFGWDDNEMLITGSLDRAVGEDVGQYAIGLGSLDAGSNYTIDYTEDSFSITARELLIEAVAGQSKVYGENDPQFTYTATGFEAGDDESILSGMLDRAAGEDAGTYDIGAGNLDAGDNYTISFTAADFEIKRRPLTLADFSAQSKIYDGTANVDGTGFSDDRLSGDVVEFSYDVALQDVNAGDQRDVTYSNIAIIEGGNAGNYALATTSGTAATEILPRPITVAAQTAKVMYGEADPILAYSVISGSLVPGDIFTGELSRTGDLNVGSYTIEQNTLTAGSNYHITYQSADFEITPRTLVITANMDQSKTYGEVDPSFTFGATNFGWEDSETLLTGSLDRVAGEDVGQYAVGQGDLDAGNNYTIDFTPADFEITQKTLTILANSDQTKIYGETDPELTYLASGFEFSENEQILTGALERAVGEDAGTYSIVAGNLDAGGNYSISFTPADFEIKRRPLVLSNFVADNKTYDGTADVSGDAFSDDRLPGDGLTFTYEVSFSDEDAGSGKDVNFTGIQIIGGSDQGNYDLKTSVGTASADIERRQLTVAAHPVEIIYGEPDPALMYGLTAGSLVTDDHFTGTLSRVENKNIGTYVIQQGDLDAGSNYDITYKSADFTITPRELTIVADVDQTKTYADKDPAFTFKVNNYGWDDGESILAGELIRTAGEDVGLYEIGQGNLNAGNNYTISYTASDFEITAKELNVVADADQQKTYGDHDPDAFTFTASNFADGDDTSMLSGSLTRDAGEGTGTYAITAGNLSAGANYQISFTTADFEILPAELIIAAVEGQTKTYGDSDPGLAWTAKGFQFSDDKQIVTGQIERDSGENTGSYELTAGTLGAGENYIISYTSADFAITPATLLVIADDDQWKFEGSEDAVLTYTAEGFLFDDGEALFNGTLEREAGETPGNYIIQIGSLSAGANYEIDFSGADFSILRTPPVVLHQSPADGEERISLDAGITAEFDHEITVADAALITLTGPDAAAIPLTSSAEGSVLTLTQGGLSHHTEYTLVIGEGALKNVDGIGNKAAMWSFTTIMSAPIAENPSPVDGATHVGVNDPLSVTFSQEVTLANASGISIISGQGGSPEGIQAELSDNVLEISHTGLDHLTEYTVSIPKGTVQNTDGVDNQPFSWSFTSIVPVPDPVVLTAPFDQQGTVALDSEFVWEPAPHAKHYRIQFSATETFEAEVTEADELTELNFTPDELLSDYQTYFWRVKAANDGGESEWSEVYMFTTIANTPSAIFPMMGSENISIAPMSEWNSEYGATYRIQLAGSEEFETTVADSLTSSQTIQLSGLNEDAEYYWRVRVETDSTESFWTDAIKFRTRPAASTEDDEQVVNHSVTFGETSNREERVISELDYRMVGLPGNDHHSVEDFFEGKYGRQWKVFYENGNHTEYYDEYVQGDERFVFAPGRGFWVLSTDIMDLDLKISSVRTNERDAFSVSLHPGWNIITNPHRGAVSWSDVMEMNDFNGDAWGYDQRFVLADTLQPVQGYYVYNHPDQPREYLDIPYATMEQRRSEDRGKALIAAKSTTPMPAVNLSAQFEENGRFDTQILYPDLAGRQADGDEALDEESLRRYYPSLEMSRSGMMLVNEEHVVRGGLLREASRFDADGTEYELHLKGETGQRFNWKLNLQNMPEQTRALIVNRVNSRTWLLQHGEEAEATLTEPNAVYSLFTGDRDRLEQLQEDLMPQEFALEPNYPNPFNPVTNIRYSLPDQQHVKLEVYDVIGRRVQVLTNDVQQAGWHVVQFDAGSLASGVYLYRLTTDNNVKVRKMTLVK